METIATCSTSGLCPLPLPGPRSQRIRIQPLTQAQYQAFKTYYAMKKKKNNKRKKQGGQEERGGGTHESNSTITRAWLALSSDLPQILRTSFFNLVAPKKKINRGRKKACMLACVVICIMDLTTQSSRVFEFDPTLNQVTISTRQSSYSNPNDTTKKDEEGGLCALVRVCVSCFSPQLSLRGA